ncbi:hypothetical protein [uncultured Slackia sp.]|uniref:hypothetical protein n=1 Tax=uncultured Slackia sp. TaxID=665903 RepID=UPI00262C8D88|nr:hypothetical protein [uncultured Slackia sp.]
MRLFLCAAAYLSTHSAVETQAFYNAVGCVDACYTSPKHVGKEPYDYQLEYRLSPCNA